jgi:hypothetical protein
LFLVPCPRMQTRHHSQTINFKPEDPNHQVSNLMHYLPQTRLGPTTRILACMRGRRWQPSRLATSLSFSSAMHTSIGRMHPTFTLLPNHPLCMLDSKLIFLGDASGCGHFLLAVPIPTLRRLACTLFLTISLHAQLEMPQGVWFSCRLLQVHYTRPPAYRV